MENICINAEPSIHQEQQEHKNKKKEKKTQKHQHSSTYL